MNDYVFNNIISGKSKITNHVEKSHFTAEQYSQLQEYYSKQKYLSPIECSLWLDVHINTIYRSIWRNRLPHIKIEGGNRGIYKLDVEKIKDKLKGIN